MAPVRLAQGRAAQTETPLKEGERTSDSPDAGPLTKKRMLDLFTGTGSVGKVYRRLGYDVTTLDIDPKWQPDICADILSWDYRKKFRPGHFHTVVVGLPCTEFSIAKTTKKRDLDTANRLAQAALKLVAYIKSQRWWL